MRCGRVGRREGRRKETYHVIIIIVIMVAVGVHVLQEQPPQAMLEEGREEGRGRKGRGREKGGEGGRGGFS